MKSTEDKSTYEPPVLTVLGKVHDLTEGTAVQPLPDGLAGHTIPVPPSG